MEQNQAFIKFVEQLRPGQIYKAMGYDMVVIIDVLRSQFTGNVALYVRFIRNIGNARQYDILELTPEKHLGVTDWQPATLEELQQATERRNLYLTRELTTLFEIAESHK